MELDHLQNQTINAAVMRANLQLDAATIEEIICALTVPLIAILIGIRVNRYITRRKHTTWGLKLIDFTAPLLSASRLEPLKAASPAVPLRRRAIVSSTAARIAPPSEPTTSWSLRK
jgi:hypothetical protein